MRAPLKFLLTILMICSLFKPSQAQLSPVWVNNIGESSDGGDLVQAVAYDASGNRYALGRFTGLDVDFDPGVGVSNLSSNGNYNELFVVKYNSSGAFIWAFNLENGNNTNIGWDIETSGTDIYITGSISGSFDMDPSSNTSILNTSGGSDGFVAKYDGTLTPSNTSFYQWAFTIGNSGLDNAYGIAVSGSDLYVTGHISGASPIDMDPSTNTNTITGTGSSLQAGYFAKYDISLTPTSTSFYKWAFRITGPSYSYGNEFAISGSDVYVTGQINGTGAYDMDPSTNTNTISATGNYDAYVAKYDGSLTPSNTSFFKWAFPTGGTDIDNGRDLAISGSDLYLIGTMRGTGTMDLDPSVNVNNITGNGIDDSFFAKYDVSLIPSNTSFYKWGFNIGGTLGDYGEEIFVSGSDVYVTGRINGTASIDLDPSANTNNITGSGNTEMYLAKYDGSLTPASTSFYQWGFSIGSTIYDVGQGLAVFGSEVLVGGGFTGVDVDFDPGAGTGFLTSYSPNTNSFIATYSTSGVFNDANGWGTDGDDHDEGRAVIVDGSNNVYTTGNFGGRTDIDPGAGTSFLISNGEQDIYINKYNASGDLVWGFAIGGTLDDFGYDLAISGSDLYVLGTINGTGSIDMDPSTNTNTITGNGGDDIFVAKYDLSLTPTNTSFYQWSFTIGGAQNDVGNDIKVSGSDIYITGSIEDTLGIDMDPSANVDTINGNGNDDIFVAKYDGSLLPSNTSFYQWSFQAGAGADDAGNDLFISGNDVYVVGKKKGKKATDMDPSINVDTINGLQMNNIFVAKYDGSLLPSNTSFYQWAFILSNKRNEEATGIVVVGSDVYIAGYVTVSFNLDMDPSTNIDTIPAGNGVRDMFIAKYDGSLLPSNTSFYQWGFSMGDIGDDYINDISISGNMLYVTGQFFGTVDMDPSVNTNNITSAGSGYDIFVANYDISLSPSNTSFYKYAFPLGGAGSENSNTMVIDGNGDLLISGLYNGIDTDFDPNPSTLLYHSYGQNAYIGKYLASIPLPIDLISFTAENIDNKYSLLEWTTLSEVNNDFFTVQRSTDGINFTDINLVDGSGNSNTIRNYVDYDMEPNVGVNYYRLKQTDFNGDSTYSNIEAVYFGTGIEIISIFPNPTSGKFFYSVVSHEDADLNVRVVNVLGEVVYQNKEEVKKGVYNLYNIDLSRLASSNYLLYIETSNGLYSTSKQLVVR